MNFTEIPSGPVALPELNQFMILLMSWVNWKLNLLFRVTDYLTAVTLR